MLQLRELDLQLAFAAAGALREDVDDQFGAIRDADLPVPLQVALLDGADRVVEDDQLDALFLELGAEPVGGAAAEIERGIRTGPPDDLAYGRVEAGGTRQRVEFVEAVGVEALATGCNRQKCDVGRDSGGGELLAGRIVFQLSGLSWWKSTARAGTTVEMACL